MTDRTPELVTACLGDVETESDSESNVSSLGKELRSPDNAVLPEAHTVKKAQHMCW